MTIQIIKSLLTSLPKSSGIYQFFDAKDQLLYIGKAKDLKSRITSYTRQSGLSPRIARMVFLAVKLEITQTNSEVEALLLEHNLIKKLQPKFNILLRDDKTFPQILITKHDFPQITKYRGDKIDKGHHFGPFASALDVNRTIDILRKIFLLRGCSDNEFKSRKKPCLEYQIKRCHAPCVNLISKDEYQNYVQNAIGFLSGKSSEVQKSLTAKMKDLSRNLEYEKAATIRDHLNSISTISAKQNINVSEFKDFDAITLVSNSEKICIYISFFRGGRNFGAKPYFFKNNGETDLASFLSNFLGQFYLTQTPPSLLLLNLELKEKKLMVEFLTKILEKNVKILTPKKGQKFSVIKNQAEIAQQNLEQKCAQELNNKDLLLEIKNIFNLEKIPERIEVYDNSHTGGENAVGAMIAAGVDGFIKSGYRKFNIGKNLTESAGKKDDTAMMREVLTRRFSKKHDGFPDLVIIDGGKGQFSATQEIFQKFGINIPFICVVKGENRNAGEERFLFLDKIIELPKHSPAMHYLQRLRDEAHRFAIMTHRKKRDKNMLLISD
jgi:excinuclease ABC subunit C